MYANYNNAGFKRKLGRRRNFYRDGDSIPNYISEAIKGKDLESLNLQSSLTVENYAERFKNLLWVEQLWKNNQLQTYNLYNRKIEHKGNGLCCVSVPGLEMGSILLRSGFFINLSSIGEDPFNERGIIEEVRAEEISARFDTTINCELSYNISFDDWQTQGHEHLAIDTYRRVDMLESIIFPEAVGRESRDFVEIEDNFTCLNGDLNYCQRKAVVNILRARARPAPHLLIGGPGTGKSRVIVEAVLQIYQRNPEAKVLVCAGTNSCADLLARMIISSGFIRSENQTGIVRLVSSFYADKEIDLVLRPILATFSSLPDRISQLRIVISTCYSAMRIKLTEKDSRFNYVFIEEIGRCTEPEALLPIRLIDGNNPTSVVLADHPEHVKPFIRSPIALEGGLATSMMHRLLHLPMYDLKALPYGAAHSNNYLTKLVTSYRCDPKIMQVCNELYFNNELQFTNHTPKRWLDALNVKSPTIFHPVYGQDVMGEGRNWKNEMEADIVMNYVQKLYSSGLPSDQLGIISGHQPQLDLLKSRFDELGLSSCRIGKIGHFSSREKFIIIISAFRTSQELVDLDKMHGDGFLLDSGKFIAAISRARWILILIGHPEILKQDAAWLKFIEQAQTVDTEPDQPGS